MTAKSLFTDRDALAALCRRHRIRRLSTSAKAWLKKPSGSSN
jgi:hypothetical protein